MGLNNVKIYGDNPDFYGFNEIKKEKKMKKYLTVRKPFIIAMLIAFFLVVGVRFGYGEEVGKFKVTGGWCIQCYHAQVLAFDDPKISGVTCYVTNVSQKYSFSDPSNASVSCRQVDTISIKQNINTSPEGEDTFAKKKSWVSKVMKVRRIYDRKRHVLNYIVYTTKIFGESYKVSMSSVVLPKTVSIR